MPGHYDNTTTLVAAAGQFVNRRTGQPVPAGTPYHMHPDKGPMEGAVHNDSIPGGTAGHDFFDRVSSTRLQTGRRGKPLTQNRNKLVSNHETLIRKRTGSGDVYEAAPNPRYHNNHRKK